MPVSKTDICKWTGLSGIQAEHIIDAMEKQDIDWASLDWKTIGEDVRDFSDKYKATWDKLGEMYNISKPTVETRIRKEIKKAKEEEFEHLIGSKEGVKSILRRIYKDPSLTKTQREKLKDKLIASAPEYATLVALYDGEEQEYAKKFLGEMIIAPSPEEIKEFLKADTLKIKSSRGWVKEINSIPLKKPIRSIEFIEYLADYELVASQPSEDFTIAVYSKEKPVLKPVEPPEVIPPKKEVKPVEAVSIPSEAKIEELVTKYSYAEVLKMAKENNIRPAPKIKMLSELITKNVL